MPIYEYACKSCGHIHEEIVAKSSAKRKTKKCPGCGKRAKFVFPNSAFHLKGGGWTNTLMDERPWSERQQIRRETMQRLPDNEAAEVQAAMSGGAAPVHDGYTENNE